MTSILDLTEQHLRAGRHHFSIDDVEERLDASHVAVRAAIRRLKRKGHLAEPARGFFVIVPPEYHSLGCLPPEQFVPALLDYWKQPYYVALLSAAQIHGAAHQRPQVFQVMLENAHRPIRCGRVRIQFSVRRDMASSPVVERNTPRGRLRVATPEVTALELVGYYDRCGGLDNVATTVIELAERVDGAKLRREARRVPQAWVQRLGYLLELGGVEHIARVLDRIVGDSAEVPLIRSGPRGHAPRSRRWRLILNSTVEADV
jgi:predicted transcriptional regulator of viral defense system